MRIQWDKYLFVRIVLAAFLLAAAAYGQDGAPFGEGYPPDAEFIDDSEMPTPEAVEAYRMKLQARLLEKYNNHPLYAGKVGKVTVALSRELQYSWDGRMIRAEMDQLVYDIWGNRLPDLEREYYVVTFGSGGVEQVRSDPSIRVGLDMEKTYSERAPLTADPFRNVPPAEAFKPTPTVAMPSWWRPDFPELD